MRKDQVACLALIQRWYHNHETGQCEPFDFDGCNKNENHFETKEECDKTCGAWHEAHKDHHHGHHGHHGHGHEHGKSHDHSNCQHGHEHSHKEHEHEGHEGHDHEEHEHKD